MRTRQNLLDTASRPNFDAIRHQIEYVPPDSLNLPRRSLRRHTKAHVRKIAAKIDRDGFIIPMVADDDLGLVIGFARLEAAKLLGLAEVPIIRVKHLPEERLEALRIFDNKIVEESDWDFEALDVAFESIFAMDSGFDISATGFEVAEVDALKGKRRTAELNDLDDTRAPEPTCVPVSRAGDMWLCGRHRLICGSSLDPDCVDALIGDAEIAQVVTDPPFNLPRRAFSSNERHDDFAQGAGELDRAGFTRFLSRAFRTVQPYLADGALVYSFMDYKHIVELILAGEAAGMSYLQLLVWAKGRAGQGSFYRSGHELVGVFRHGSAQHRNNIALGKFGRNRSNVLSYPGVMGSAGAKKALAMHPTVKNVAMLADLMLDASAPGEAIFDGFGGSGSTLIAAEKTDRIAYLCEISPGFVDIAVDRFNALGVGEARLAATGQTFTEVAADRAADANGEG